MLTIRSTATDPIVCAYRPCAKYCPVADLGRDCPDVDEFYGELDDQGVSLDELARRLG